MRIAFSKISPGGNETVIVRTSVPTASRASLSKTLMSSRYVGGEQVGYLSIPRAADIDARIDMMGGELCINALRSVATILAEERGKTCISLASSGTDKVFECRSNERNGTSYTSITFHVIPRIRIFCGRTSLIGLTGISHLLYECESRVEIDNPLRLFRKLQKQYANELSALPAFGIIPFRRRQSGYDIFPVVYVRGTNTIVAESACGSASVALALSKTGKDCEKSFRIRQPSGCVYDVQIRWTCERAQVLLGSPVQLLVSGIATVPSLQC